MTFYALLEALLKIKKPVKQTDLEVLAAGIQKDHGQEGVELLHKALIGLGLKEAENQDGELKETPYPQSARYSKFYNHSLYQKLLPLCQLAYMSEHNGDAKEHAFKLATIFGQEQKALAYLFNFKGTNSNNYLVHDACLFDLADPAACDFKQWQRLAQINLLNPRFRELLPHAAELEKIGQTGKYTKKHPINQMAIDQNKKDLTISLKNYKDLSRKPVVNLDEQQRRKRQEDLSQLNNEIAGKRQNLTVLCRGLRLEAVDMLVLEAFYESYRSSHEEGHKILIENGIAAKSIAKFQTLKCNNDDNAIPNFLIDGQELGYSGFYLKKLDTLSHKGAALAACLGKITRCCQYFGGVGEDCAIHGITSPNGGFYVVCKGDAKKTSLDDPILAQSWVWKGQSNSLCLDSIEAASTKKAEQQAIADLYRFLGHSLCQKFGIPRVNTGAQSGITSEIALRNYPTQKVHFLDYVGYCDSRSQLALANQAMPYLLYGQTQSAALQNILIQETKLFFKDLFLTPGALKDNNALKQAIIFALHPERIELLGLLSQAATDSNNPLHKIEFDLLLDINKEYLKQLNKGLINFTLIEQGAYIDAMNAKGQSAVHLAALAADLKAFDHCMQLHPNINIQDKYGNTALINALEKVLYDDMNELGRTIASRLIRAGADLDIKDDDEITPLMLAVRNQDLPLLKDLVEHGADIDTFDGDMKTALFLAAEQGQADIFDYLLKKGAKPNIISYREGNNLLMAALRSKNQAIAAASFARLESIPGVLRQQNKRGENALIVAVKEGKIEIVKAILSSPHSTPEILRQQMMISGNALAAAAIVGNIEIVQAILSSRHCTPDMLRQQNEYGENALIAAVREGTIGVVQAILSSPHSTPEMLRQQNEYGENALIVAARERNIRVVQAILSSPHFTPEMLIQNEQWKENAITAAARKGNIEIVQAILSSPYSTPEMLMQKGSGRDNALIAAARRGNIEIVQAILSSRHSTPEMFMGNEQWMDNALIEAAREGNIEIAQAILSSRHCTPEMLMQNGWYGDNVLIVAAKKGIIEIVQAILSSRHCTPEMLRQQNDYGENALIVAAREGNIGVVQAILASPYCTHEVLQQKNKSGFGALQEAMRNGNLGISQTIIKSSQQSTIIKETSRNMFFFVRDTVTIVNMTMILTPLVVNLISSYLNTPTGNFVFDCAVVALYLNMLDQTELFRGNNLNVAGF